MLVRKKTGSSLPGSMLARKKKQVPSFRLPAQQASTTAREQCSMAPPGCGQASS